jgi:hypothetical protein
MRHIAHDDSVLLILSPLAIGIAVYLVWCFKRGRITVRSITSIRKKEPFGFWSDFISMALFDAMLWLVVMWGFAALFVP